MKRFTRIIFSALMLVITVVTAAQDTILISSIAPDSVNTCERFTAYFTDSSNSKTVNEILHQHFIAQPKIPDDLLYHRGRKIITTWLRWQIRNDAGTAIDIFFLFHRLTNYSLYLQRGQSLQRIKSPPAFYTAETKNQRRSSQISFSPGETVILYAAVKDPPDNLMSGYPVVSKDAAWKGTLAKSFYDHRYFIFVDIVFLGIILFIIIHTLAQYFFNRRNEFLLYAFYGTVVFAYMLFKFEEINYMDISFSYFPYLQKYGNILLSYLLYFSYYRFVRCFIDFKTIAPRFYTLIIVTEWLLIFSAAADVLLISLHLQPVRGIIFNVLRCYLLVIGFTGIYILFRSGSRQAYFIAIGSCCLLVGALTSMVISWVMFDRFPGIDALAYMKLGMVFELLFFTLGLSYKTSLIEKEKVIAQQQLIVQLKENKQLQDELTTKLESRVRQQMLEIIAQQQQLEREKEQQLTLEFGKKITEMELQVLKSQLNPHFYFNTLNNLYGLTVIDHKQAPAAILKLSDIMEYIIYDCKNEKVPLEKELKFISSYIDLEKLRYENNSRISLELGGNITGRFISPMLLIQFVENAFKHGMEQNKDDCYLQVNITARENELQYRSVNGINEKKFRSSGVGLTNVQKRLNLLYPGKHRLSIEEDGFEFKVALTLDLS